MTIKQVAGKVGISVDTLMRIEKNRYTLYKPDKLKKLCEILKIQAEKICSPYQSFLMNNQGEQIFNFLKILSFNTELYYLFLQQVFSFYPYIR